jgi:GH24 family phage-related lysozyme (muramidase)
MAAQACPTKAIKIIDRYTGNQLYPWKSEQYYWTVVNHLFIE